MRIAALFLALPLLLGAAGPAPTELTIALENYRFDPATIRLQHGRPYVLHLVNRSGGGHNFVVPGLLAGKVEVASGATADVVLVVPAAGRYPLKCTHFMHSTFGMKGSIIVE
jgi:plastocyanin